MKKLITILSLGLSCYSSVLLAESNIGVIDLERIATESIRFKEMESSLRKQLEAGDKEILKKNEALSKQAEAFRKNSPTMKEEVKKAEQSKLEGAQKQYQEAVLKHQREVNAKTTVSQKDLYERIGQASSTIAEKKELGLVLLKAVSVYYNPKLDITKEVIELLDKEVDKAKETK